MVHFNRSFCLVDPWRGLCRRDECERRGLRGPLRALASRRLGGHAIFKVQEGDSDDADAAGVPKLTPSFPKLRSGIYACHGRAVSFDVLR